MSSVKSNRVERLFLLKEEDEPAEGPRIRELVMAFATPDRDPDPRRLGHLAVANPWPASWRSSRTGSPSGHALYESTFAIRLGRPLARSFQR